MEYDIFVSYRRIDPQGRVEGRDIARLLTKELKLYGYNVFFDYSEIKDNDFEEAILPAIRNCKIFILLLTANALIRCINERDWVRREIMEAYNSSKKIITVNPGYEFKGFPINLPKDLIFLETIQMSVIDVESNFEVTVKKMVQDRIQLVVQGSRIVDIKSDNRDLVRFKLGGQIFEIPDEFFNSEVYKAIKRSYE